MKTIRELRDEHLRTFIAVMKATFTGAKRRLRKIQACAVSMQFRASSHGPVTGTNFALGSYK